MSQHKHEFETKRNETAPDKMRRVLAQTQVRQRNPPARSGLFGPRDMEELQVFAQIGPLLVWADFGPNLRFVSSQAAH